jgi:hypothetical protein
MEDSQMADIGTHVGGAHAHSTPQTTGAPPGETARRKDCILRDLGGKNQALFKVAPNPYADSRKDFHEVASKSMVAQFDKFIQEAADAKAIPADLIRAIMYMETTRGHYDRLVSWGNFNKSILPMNINVNYWGSAFGTRDTLKNPRENIQAGAEMLKRIIKCMPDNSTIEQIASVYNSLGATNVSNYGARVGAIHRGQIWKLAK